ncbi:MAG: ATPase, T2SS/T4P/T4SS family [Acidimicrobiia bacterium]
MTSLLSRDEVVDAYEVIRSDVLASLERSRVNPDTDPEAVQGAILAAISDYERRCRVDGLPSLGDAHEVSQRIFNAVCGHGPISGLIARDDVEEIFVEGSRISYLDQSGHLHGLATPATEEENRQLIDRLLSATDRHLSTQQPLVQARVLNGAARLTVAIPPISDTLSATFRKYTVREARLEDLVTNATMSQPAADFLRLLLRARSRLMISGEPGAGTTTLLTALLNAAPPQHCVRVCEEIREIAAPIMHGGYYETRPPGMDGTGEISLRHLVKFVLAMRPDRIVVGEVRGAEAFELTRAVNAGCGFLCTVHANTASDALNALVNAALMAGENVTEPIIRRVFSNALDVVVQIGRVTSPSGTVHREISEILAVHPSLSEGFTTESLFSRTEPRAPLEWQGSIPERLVGLLASVLPPHRTVADIAAGRGLS